MKCSASAVTTQPLSCKSSISCKRQQFVVVRGQDIGKRHAVCAAQAVTMTGGMWLLPRS